MAKKVEKKKPVFITSTSIQLLSVQQQIFVIRGKQVMVDRDLAALYGVETRVLKQSVKRNPERFPEEFMFQLDNQEFEKWRSQIVMSNSDKMGLRYPPFVFTEQGVAMIYKVLGMLSERYIASKERKPIGYEAIDAERKAKTNKENNEDN